MATKTRNPTSEVAVTGTWSGTSRHLLLDDHPDGGNPIADGTTCSAAGVLVMGFSVFDVPAGSASLSVQVIYYDFKNGSQTAAAGSLIRCNDTTDRVSATHNPGNGNANITLRTDNWATNPKSGANWTVDDVNGIGTNGLTALGLRVTDASPTSTFSSAIIQVTYTPPVTGTLAASEAADDATAAGTVAWQGTMAATEGADSASFAGTVTEGVISGSLSATEPIDIAALAGQVTVSGALAGVEVQDSASLAGDVLIAGGLSTTETADALAFAGTVKIAGVLGASESADSLSASGTLLVSGSFATIEAFDVLAASGSVGAAIFGSLGCTEAQDLAILAGQVSIIGALAAVEAQDSLLFADLPSSSAGIPDALVWRFAMPAGGRVPGRGRGRG